jgi:molybdenum cofactor cytidylyltransferase
MKRIGVLLAAGQSKRMGRPKQLLPWPPKGENPKPLVAAAFDAIARVCDEMVVVVGHQAEEVVAALGERTFHRTAGDLGAELFASIRRGLLGASQIDPTADVLLQPADHPQVRLDTLQTLLARLAENAGLAVMPTYRCKGGHPVCMPMAIVNEVLGYAGRGGLRQFWVDHPELCVRLPVDDPGVVFDIDTQSDYDFCVQ